MKLEITLSMSPVFKCCDIIMINFIISCQIVHLQSMSRKDDVKLPNRICDNIVHLGWGVMSGCCKGSLFSISNLKFPRLCAKLFLVTLNIAWNYVVPSEDHICPKNEDDPKKVSTKSGDIEKVNLFSKKVGIHAMSPQEESNNLVEDIAIDILQP